MGATSKKVKDQKLFFVGTSYIEIKDSKLYVMSTRYRDFSPNMIQVLDGFQIELGRNINDFKSALKMTRLPVMIKNLIDNGVMQQYQVIRIKTGKVDDRVVATIMCQNNLIKTISFNKELLKDMQYRKYNNLSIYHQLVIPYDYTASGAFNRVDQVRRLLSIATFVRDINVQENGGTLSAFVPAEGLVMRFNFISDKQFNLNYKLSSITAV